jgi:hypothetical protein
VRAKVAGGVEEIEPVQFHPSPGEGGCSCRMGALVG